MREAIVQLGRTLSGFLRWKNGMKMGKKVVVREVFSRDRSFQKKSAKEEEVEGREIFPFLSSLSRFFFQTSRPERLLNSCSFLFFLF